MADLQSVQYSDKTFSLPTGEAEHVELTQAQYNALSDAEKMNGKVYFITDGQVPSVDFVKYIGDATDAAINASVAANTLQIVADYAETGGYKGMAFNIGEKVVARYKRKADNSWEETGRWMADEDTGWQTLTGSLIDLNYRRKNGIIYVNASGFTLKDNIPAGDTLIGTMPDGFRPSLYFPTAVMTTLSKKVVGFLNFHPTGSVTLRAFEAITIVSSDALAIGFSYPV